MGVAREMLGPMGGSRGLAVVRWKGDLVIRGHLAGLKLWAVHWLGVLSVAVGVLLGVVVGHDFCWQEWRSGAFIIGQTRASVMEHSIGIISAALTDIGSWSSGMGEMARSASADGQSTRKKTESARRRPPRTTVRTAKWPQR